MDLSAAHSSGKGREREARRVGGERAEREMAAVAVELGGRTRTEAAVADSPDSIVNNLAKLMAAEDTWIQSAAYVIDLRTPGPPVSVPRSRLPKQRAKRHKTGPNMLAGYCYTVIIYHCDLKKTVFCLTNFIQFARLLGQFLCAPG